MFIDIARKQKELTERSFREKASLMIIKADCQ